jgi:hypothetical protein
VVREHVRVVLQVVADLAARRVLEQRLQPREQASRQLVRRAGVVGARAARRPLAGLDAERHADDLRRM